MKYLEVNKLIDDSQNGFRKNRSTEDHVIMRLRSIAQERLNKKEHTYVAFIDYAKAFD